MSAYVVDKEHIDVMMAVALRGPSGRPVSPDTAWNRPSWYIDGRRMTLDYTNADEVGAMLVGTNLASVHARHPDTIDDPEMMPGPIAQYWNDSYVWTDPRCPVTAVEALQAIEGYEYQSCEHDGWNTGEAKAFCDSLRRHLIQALPGMREAPWTWTADHIAARRGVRV